MVPSFLSPLPAFLGANPCQGGDSQSKCNGNAFSLRYLQELGKEGPQSTGSLIFWGEARASGRRGIKNCLFSLGKQWEGKGGEVVVTSETVSYKLYIVQNLPVPALLEH